MDDKGCCLIGSFACSLAFKRLTTLKLLSSNISLSLSQNCFVFYMLDVFFTFRKHLQC
jgi:hypothetical protein